MAKQRFTLGKQLQKLLEECDEEIKEEYDNVLRKYTSLILEDAVRNVPVKTGYLQGSIQYEFLYGGTRSKIWAGAEYAYIVEHGNSSRYPKPFLHPAFDKYKDDFLAEAQKILDDILRH